jgi:acyl-[acyl-carrier-protein] desaturase
MGVAMSDASRPSAPAVEAEIYRLYRDFFDTAEKKRRWSVRDDIPWAMCNPALAPAVADVVELFCAVELFLPDYVGKILPHVRGHRGRAWFAFTWGYEESKHSLALGDWLLRAGMRTEGQMADLEALAVGHEWQLPLDDAWGMVCYSMVQEAATWLHYRNLRRLVGEAGDPALYRLLGLIGVDERAHYDFFRRVVALQLAHDRPATLESLRRVMNDFRMPAVHLLADGPGRVAAVKALNIFDEEAYYKDVYLPVLADLGVSRAEMRNRWLGRKSLTAGPA